MKRESYKKSDISVSPIFRQKRYELKCRLSSDDERRIDDCRQFSSFCCIATNSHTNRTVEKPDSENPAFHYGNTDSIRRSEGERIFRGIQAKKSKNERGSIGIFTRSGLRKKRRRMNQRFLAFKHMFFLTIILICVENHLVTHPLPLLSRSHIPPRFSPLFRQREARSASAYSAG